MNKDLSSVLEYCNKSFKRIDSKTDEKLVKHVVAQAVDEVIVRFEEQLSSLQTSQSAVMKANSEALTNTLTDSFVDRITQVYRKIDEVQTEAVESHSRTAAKVRSYAQKFEHIEQVSQSLVQKLVPLEQVPTQISLFEGTVQKLALVESHSQTLAQKIDSIAQNSQILQQKLVPLEQVQALTQKFEGLNN